MAGNLYLNGMLYEESYQIHKSRQPRSLTFFGGPKDGMTEYVQEICVASPWPDDEPVESWVIMPFQSTDWQPGQETEYTEAFYTVVNDMAFFVGSR